MESVSITILALASGTTLGWFGRRLFGPTVDELGVHLKSFLISIFKHNEYSIYLSYSHLHELITKLHKESGYSCFSSQKPYLHDHIINLEIQRKTNKELRGIVATWIDQTHIGSYAESDIFFAGLELLMQQLTTKNLLSTLKKYENSSQAIFWPFLEKVEKKRPDLLTAELLNYLRREQKKHTEHSEKYIK